MEFPVRIQRRAFNPVKLLASPKRVVGFVTAGLTFLTIARIVVCLVEAYSEVRHERLADEGLMRSALADEVRALSLIHI